MNHEQVGVAVNGVESPLFTKDEAARYLRLDLSAPKDPVQAVDRLVRDGKIYPVHIGRRALFHKSVLDGYLSTLLDEARY